MFSGMPDSWQGVLTAFIVFLFIYGWRPFCRYKYRHIPGPPSLWLLGNVIDLIKKERPRVFQEWAKTYGPVYKIFQGGTVVVVVADAAAARTVNMRNHSRAPLLTFFAGKEGDYDNAGLLVTKGGSYWQSLRQAWQAMFHPDSLRGYIGFVNKSADNLVDALAQAAKSGETVEIWRMMGRLTMEVVGSSAFGMELKCFDITKVPIEADANKIQFEEADEIDVTVQKVAAVLFGFEGVADSIYPVLQVLFPELKPVWGRLVMWLPDKKFKRLLKARHLMRDICYRLVNEARADTAPRQAANQVPHDPAEKVKDGKQLPRCQKARGLPPGGFVRHMVEADNKMLGRPFTDLEIVSQINTFMLAGYETTASALTFTCYYLSLNPEAEKKLLQEIDAFGRSKEPSYDDLSNLPYLTACIDESLRLSSPGGFGTLRLNREATELCGIPVPQGAYINTASYAIQHSEQYWEDPLAFRPERLLTPPGTSTPSWAAFGEGGRACVGLRLAYAEAKIALIKLYQHYTLRLVPGQVPLETKTTISHSPRHGVHVTVHSRD